MNEPAAQSAAWTALFLAWATALVAVAGALFLGEVVGKPPCVLCWYQRIAMFPLVVVLGLGLLPFDTRCVRYALPLVLAGWLIALYHMLTLWGLVSVELVPCGQGSSCADAAAQSVGAVPIPLLSLGAFTVILALLLYVRREARS